QRRFCHGQRVRRGGRRPDHPGRPRARPERLPRAAFPDGDGVGGTGSAPVTRRHPHRREELTAMYKLIFGAKRKPGMSREDFGRYWTTVHAEKAKKVPGIIRYVINLAPDLSGSRHELPYDGF